jgi:hypothetical protein
MVAERFLAAGEGKPHVQALSKPLSHFLMSQRPKQVNYQAQD